MRLLLLLSALFTALAGVGGTRAQAQPVQASAAALVPVATAAAVSPVTARFAGASAWRVPPVQPRLPDLVGAVARRLLYAERRRE